MVKFTILLMLTMNDKILKFFVLVLQLEVDGSNWVIFKVYFAFMAATASLEKHINATGIALIPLTFTLGGPFLFTTKQMAKLELYEENKLKWMMDETIIQQAITTTISDSLFIEI